MPLQIMNITLDNFKSFKHIELDVANKKGKEAKGLVCIYGENGSGKTNLINSMLFLHQSIHTMSLLKMVQKVLTEESKAPEEFVSFVRTSFMTNTEMLAKEYHYIADNNPMKAQYTFLFNGSESCYTIEIHNGLVVSETLAYKIKKKLGFVFKIVADKIEFSPTIFKKDSYNTDLRNKIQQYWGKHSFLAIVLAEAMQKNESFIKEAFDDSFITFIKELEDISIISSKAATAYTDYEY